MIDPGYIQILLLVAFLVPVVFFFLTQQRTLELVRPANRKMRPGLVWLQFIPLFGLVWQFIVISKIADSIRNELNAPVGDSIFADDTSYITDRPTYNAGISYAALFCMTIFFPGLLKTLASLAGLIVWINYWVLLSRYKKKLKERALTIS